MRSATAFLPSFMMTLPNLVTSTLPYFGSGRISRRGTSLRRGISRFLSLQLAPVLPGDPVRHQAGHLLDTGSIHPPGPSRAPLGGLWALGAVLRTRLLAILDALRIQRTAHHVVAHARQIFDAAAANQYN